MKELASLLAQDLDAGSTPASVEALVTRIREDLGDAVVAVLFYGSCRRRASGEGLADLLVLVDDYRNLPGGTLATLGNRVLPPNVYYLEVATATGIQRCKFAVISLPGFSRRCRQGLDAYFRARFAQPCRLLWARDQQARSQVLAARADAIATFCAEFAPRVTGTLSAEAFWQRALSASYRCELRPEPPSAAAQLVAADADYFRATGATILPRLPGVTALANGEWNFRPDPATRRRAALLWGLRRPWSKTLNVLRLLKAAGTFSNGIDYLLWKIERHSGVKIEATRHMRRYPRLAAIGLAWTVWRRKVLQ